MPHPPDMPREERRGLAVASLLIGTASLLLSTLLVGGLVAVAGIGCGVAHLATRRGGVAMASFGIALSVAAIPASIGLGVLYYRMSTAFSDNILTQFDMAKDYSYWEGVRAPDFSVTTFDGAAFALSEHRGEFVVAHVAKVYGGEYAKHLKDWDATLPLVQGGPPVSIVLTDAESGTSRFVVSTYGVECPMANGVGLDGPYGEMLDEDLYFRPYTLIIDRNGVIKRVINYRTDETPESLAALLDSGDYQGDVLEALPKPKHGLTDAVPTWRWAELWTVELGSVGTMTTGDWDRDGVDDVVLAGADNQLKVFGRDGREVETHALPHEYWRIGIGRGPDGATLLLGERSPHPSGEVDVVDATGDLLWSKSTRFGSGTAIWCDVDADGIDEVLTATFGMGGLRAYTHDGEELWRKGGMMESFPSNTAVLMDGRPSFLTIAMPGGIRIYDGEGTILRSIQPGEVGSVNSIAAGAIQVGGRIQILGHDGENVFAYDQNGREIWNAPMPGSSYITDDRLKARLGDFDGDGTREWVYLNRDTEPTIVSASGERYATMDEVSADDVAVAKGAEGHDILVVLEDRTLRAYRFARP